MITSPRTTARRPRRRPAHGGPLPTPSPPLPPTAQRYFDVARALGIVPSPEASWSFEDLFAGVPLAGRRLLDVGGGNGFLSFYAAAMGAREAVCLEPRLGAPGTEPRWSFDRLRAALPEAPVTVDTRRIQDFTAGERFEVVLVHGSIHHLDAPACERLARDEGARDAYRRVFARLRAAARPGAKLVVYDRSPKNLFPLLRLRHPLCPKVAWRRQQAPEVWARLLAEAGFGHPTLRWEPLYCFGRPGRVLLGNRAAAFFLKGLYLLHLEAV